MYGPWNSFQGPYGEVDASMVAVVAQEEGGQLCALHPAGRELPLVQLHKYVAFPLPMWYIT